MSIDALAMAGADCMKCSINFEEMEHTDLEMTAEYLLADQNDRKKGNNQSDD